MGEHDFRSRHALPPDVQKWIDKKVVQLQATLDNPETRARIRKLLNEPTTQLGNNDEYSETP